MHVCVCVLCLVCPSPYGMSACVCAERMWRMNGAARSQQLGRHQTSSPPSPFFPTPSFLETASVVVVSGISHMCYLHTAADRSSSLLVLDSYKKRGLQIKIYTSLRARNVFDCGPFALLRLRLRFIAIHSHNAILKCQSISHLIAFFDSKSRKS